ncbi:metal ABC transporter solute-binding protein, Zn/Mn family [Candidatus Anaplasma sp. TIGMIC]|uniref:metal ABC transporter solute-binding protein, Zn/Mn family n=1 Tax=Candidatus Anaplasma sp. TIGMIC TaxID=3020713 RepID=UPI00232BF0A5|nr:zinc ABC transporter substrate-binding protein [Candidatus Anaplasma sp. TIGMIC]MDB1135106.1 zinc ABC transporter substrate-binding protein [Candidatus Anaplasma sp. TIGMIC]
MLTVIHAVLLLVAMALPIAGYTVPKVAATINPIHLLVIDVGRGVVQPVLPSVGVSCVHDYVLKPSDVAGLNSANIVFYVDEHMEPYIKKLSRDSGKTLVRLSDVVELLPQRSSTNSKHGHNFMDFHIWLSPDNVKKIVKKICATLSEADPENAPIYRSNTRTILQNLVTMTDNISKVLEPVKDIPYIVVHDAYQYFDRFFGLNFVASLPSNHATANELVAAKNAAKRHSVRCIFTDVPDYQHGHKLVNEAVKVRYLDPVGISIPPKTGGYFKLMETLAHGFRECLE